MSNCFTRDHKRNRLGVEAYLAFREEQIGKPASSRERGGWHNLSWRDQEAWCNAAEAVLALKEGMTDG